MEKIALSVAYVLSGNQLNYCELRKVVVVVVLIYVYSVLLLITGKVW